MSSRRSLLCALALVLGIGAVDAWADDVRVDLRAEDGWLLVDARTDALVDGDVDRALRSGLPTRVTMEVSLWVARDALWDRLVTEARIETRVLFDLLEERYDVLDEDGIRLLSTARRDSMALAVQEIVDFPLETVDVVDEDAEIYVVVSLRAEPLTVEEMRDLERWLQGNLRGESESGLFGRLSRQLFGVVKGRVGLGDREVRGRSSARRVDRLERDMR